MSITVYSDVILTGTVVAAAGLRGKNMRRNQRTASPSGRAAVNIQQSRTLRQFELGFIPMLVDTWQQIEGTCEVTEYGAFGFLMEDPKDSIVAIGEGFLYPYLGTVPTGTDGLGYGLPSYQLYKRYSSIGGARSKDRKITRPRATPALKRGGSAVTFGASPGNASINLDTGAVVFVADSSSTVTAVTVGATTSVTLTAALAGLTVGGRLYLSGLTGADAALLNGKSHAITGISGGGSNVYALSTNTSGKTITAAGSGYKYPQASETLTWSGSFYVPVHFANDDFDWSLDRANIDEENRLVSGPGSVLDEIWE